MNALAKTAAALGGAFVLLLAGLVLLFGGIWLGGHPGSLPEPLRNALVEDDRALRAEVVEAIEDDYYRDIPDEKVTEDSLTGIVDGLDRFSHYISPQQSDAFEQSVQGRFEGVGMTVDEDPRGLRVTDVFDGSPADRAGIKPGEFITAVNGRSIAGASTEVATARIKGKAGTRVRLELVDPEEEEARTLRVERAEIQVPVVEGRLERRDGEPYGVVELTTFSEGAHGLLRKEIDRLLERGAEGIVLDLRGNGGGLLTEAVLVSSIFIEDGLVTYTEGRSRPKREFEAQGDAIDGDVPVVVLVDRGSASASEIVTGALRDRERATVVGTRTFGKGVFQEVQKLSNGGVLDITVGQYFLPSGENIGMKGVKPSVRATDDVDTERDEALPVALRELAEKAARE
jgi:carboxyl-terminal processing protease